MQAIVLLKKTQSFHSVALITSEVYSLALRKPNTSQEKSTKHEAIISYCVNME